MKNHLAVDIKQLQQQQLRFANVVVDLSKASDYGLTLNSLGLLVGKNGVTRGNSVSANPRTSKTASLASQEDTGRPKSSSQLVQPAIAASCAISTTKSRKTPVELRDRTQHS